MALRADVVVFLALVAGSAYAISTQLGRDPLMPVQKASDAPPPVGSTVDLSGITLDDIGGKPRPLPSLFGAKATVLVFWSVECPCVEMIDPRLRELLVVYEKKGVEFVGVDGYPDDAVKDVIAKMGNNYTAYRMLLDPKQVLTRKVGARTAAELVVLDASSRIRYRGNMDDDLMQPKVPHLKDALDAILSGTEPKVTETEPYGCPYPGFEGECTYDPAKDKK